MKRDFSDAILNKKHRKVFSLVIVVFMLLIIGVDQITKFLSDTMIPYGGSVPLIPRFLEISNVHNTGAAWGMMSGGRWVFIALTIVVCALLFYVLFSKKYSLTTLSYYGFMLICAGAIGNLIDRIVLGYVRDMINFVIIHFPVFNVADSAVTIGAVLLILDILINRKNSFFARLDEKKENDQNK